MPSLWLFPCSLNFLQDLDRIQGPLRGLLVLEVSEYVASSGHVLADSSDHILALLGCVGRLAVAVVAEIGSEDVRRDALFGFGYAQRAIAGFEKIEHFVAKPGRMPEIKGQRHTARQDCQEFFQHLSISLHIWR